MKKWDDMYDGFFGGVRKRMVCYQIDKNPLHWWAIYRAYRKAGNAVPERLLKHLDDMADKLLDEPSKANDEREIKRAVMGNHSRREAAQTMKMIDAVVSGRATSETAENNWLGSSAVRAWKRKARPEWEKELRHREELKQNLGKEYERMQAENEQRERESAERTEEVQQDFEEMQRGIARWMETMKR